MQTSPMDLETKYTRCGATNHVCANISIVESRCDFGVSSEDVVFDAIAHDYSLSLLENKSLIDACISEEATFKVNANDEELLCLADAPPTVVAQSDSKVALSYAESQVVWSMSEAIADMQGRADGYIIIMLPDCSVTVPRKMKVTPKVLWLNSSMYASGIFNVVSDTDWKIE